jgi:CHAT domain-containing protein/tetratricopeptide (TPR) repeat protein
VGKGARNRAKKKAERGLSEELIHELWQLDSPDSLLTLLARHPDLEDGRANQELREMATMPGFGAGFAPFVELLSAIRRGPQSAWESFVRRRDEIEVISKCLERTSADIEKAEVSGDHDRVVALAAPAAQQAEAAGLGLAASEFHSQHGLALLRRNSRDRATDLEQSIKAHEAALGYSQPGERRASLLAHLGLVYAERVRGDRAENLAVSAGLLREALDETPSTGDPDLDALIRTNLAMALLRGEVGDRRAVLLEAVDLCRAALRYRSPQRNPVDWAYSKLNFGEAVEALCEIDRIDPQEAIEAYQSVAEEADQLPERWLVGSAHYALGRLRRRAADVVGLGLEDQEQPDPREEAKRRTLLRDARVDLLAAQELMRDAPDPLRRGFMLDELGNVAAALGLVDEAIASDREALSILRPTSSPRACTAVGWRLGNMLAERDEWSEAAGAFRDAVQAAELSFHGRLATTARQEEIERVGNLNRWAAFALARAGDDTAAALALENGRARELRRRIGLDQLTESDLDDVPDELLVELRESATALVGAPMGGPGEDPAYRFQRVLAEIRALPGREAFGTGATRDDLVGAVDAAWPLMYVNPTPYGTLLLLLRRDGNALAFESSFVPVRALDVYLQLTLGITEAELPAAAQGEIPQRGSYFLAITGGGQESDFQWHLEQPLPWLGQEIALPIRDAVAAVGGAGVTLVGCGPIVAAPIHAAPWDDDGERRCLIDDLNVRYAPSATVCSAARRRAAQPRGTSRLLALADPTTDLSAAKAEADEISRHFASDCRAVAVNGAADRAFLEAHVGDATHLHLACHGEASLLEGRDPAVLLADGAVTADELIAMRCPQLRLAVISACQSGMSDASRNPDEVVSVGAVMLAAGSAGAVVSLWPVHSLATAMLMAGFYERLCTYGDDSAEALRHAQCWLRDLTAVGEAEFLSSRPALADEFRRHAAARDLPGRRSTGSAPHQATTPYAHPDYWAAFVVLGA